MCEYTQTPGNVCLRISNDPTSCSGCVVHGPVLWLPLRIVSGKTGDVKVNSGQVTCLAGQRDIAVKIGTVLPFSGQLAGMLYSVETTSKRINA